jgi:hypothetical protein
MICTGTSCACGSISFSLLVAEKANEAAVRTQLAALVKLRQGLDPFELSRQVDRKLHAIYALAHTRLSPRVPANARSGRVTF